MLEFSEKTQLEKFSEKQQLEKNSSLKYEEIFKNLFSDDYDNNEVKLIEPENSIIYDSKEIMTDLFKNDFMNTESYEIETASDVLDELFDTDSIPTELNREYEPNLKFEENGKDYETDDNGIIYKLNGKELIPNIEYTIDGVRYTTDEQGRITSCDGNAKQTPEGTRDIKAQEQAGGKDRKEGDQGSHILARILGGSKGIENMLAMRGTINQGPYHTMEKEIDKALSDGKKVHIHVEVKYEGDSKRPSKIIVTYTIDGKKTIIEYDNDEGSISLLNSVEDKVDREQYNDLKQEILDANEDGAKMSIISVKIEYDENKNVVKITVIMRDENSGGPNEKRVLFPKEDVK